MNRMGKGGLQEREESHTLAILEAIEREKGVTQRRLAKRLGVALGLTNAYLKRCARKGLIKVTQAPANRYVYYLTPRGFAEKSRLTAKYLSYSLSFYRKASTSCASLYDHCQRNEWKTAVLFGVSELAEIAALQAIEHEIEVLGIYDRSSGRTKFLNKPVWKEFSEAPPGDAYLLTALRDPQQSLNELLEVVKREKILVPDVLGLSIDGQSSSTAQ
jgi:DNA-binding MarR family transcriptional regulator